MNFRAKPLKEIEEAQVREYGLHGKDEREWSSATLRIGCSGIKFFCPHTFKRDGETLRLLKAQRHVTPPTVLSIDQVRRILAALPMEMNRTLYTTVYSLGLRLGEARYLAPAHLDRKRMCMRIPEAKGGFTRTAPGRDGKQAPSATVPVSETTVQGALRRTVKNLKIDKHVHPHTFRHAYAAHPIEAGVPIRRLQQRLGFFGVLHTWGRQLQHHPHLHFPIPGGRLSKHRDRWVPAPGQFQVHVRALDAMFRGQDA